MQVEIGPKIHEVFLSSGMKLTDFADRLGTVRQNVYRIFKKTHVDTGLLLKISKVLNHNFFQYYVHPPEHHPGRPERKSQQKKKDEDLLWEDTEQGRKMIRLLQEKAALVRKLERETIAD